MLFRSSHSASFYRNVGEVNGETIFRDMGLLDELQLAGHTTSPTVIDFSGSGIPWLLIGAEDGFFYYRKNHLINSSK